MGVFESYGYENLESLTVGARFPFCSNYLTKKAAIPEAESRVGLGL